MRTRKINPRTTTVADAAKILGLRFGHLAMQEASNRCDAARTEVTASFYENVLEEIARLTIAESGYLPERPSRPRKEQ